MMSDTDLRMAMSKLRQAKKADSGNDEAVTHLIEAVELLTRYLNQ